VEWAHVRDDDGGLLRRSRRATASSSRPPELAPYSVMRLGELFIEGWLPRWRVQCRHRWGRDIGEAMVAHPGIDKIQFVGSGPTAKKVLRNAGRDAEAMRAGARRQVGG